MHHKITCNHSKQTQLAFCAGNSPVTDEFPVEKAGNAEHISIWWRHYESVSIF